MIYKEIPIQVEGSDKTSRAQFYILDTLPDEMKIQKRPIILICPGGGTTRSVTGKENLLPGIF